MNCGCRWKWRMFIAVNLSNWKEEAWQNQGLNGIRTHDLLEYRCDALPTELWSHTLGARSIYWVHISSEEWNGVKFIWIDLSGVIILHFLSWPIQNLFLAFVIFFLRNTACRHGHELYTDHSFNLILTTAHPCEIHAGGKQLKDIKLQKKSKSGRQEGLLQALHACNVRCADVLNNLKWKNPWSQALPYKGYPYV